jgi:delta-aminolevulinic acid dehydratase/porphobilinogen synthase
MTDLITRPRRLRQSASLRAMFEETSRNDYWLAVSIFGCTPLKALTRSLTPSLMALKRVNAERVTTTKTHGCTG